MSRSAHLEGWDGADFALALDRFDVAAQQPHFPGYPVFVALAHLLSPLGGAGPAGALTLPCALVGGAAAWAMWRLGGWGAALLYVAAPGLWLLGGKPLSDGAGLGLLLFTFALAGSRPGVSGVLAGLTLGVRLSYAPALLGWLWLVRGRPSRRAAALGLAVGLLAWGIPLIVVSGGPAQLWAIGQRFLGGHFGEWGGAVGYLGAGERLRRQSWGLCAWLLGGIGPSDVGFVRLLTTVSLGLALVTARGSSVARGALLFALPYLVWALLGQNPDRPRHLAPVAAAILVAAGSTTRRRFWLAAAAGMVVTAVPLVRAQATTAAPDTALVRWVAAHRPAARVYAWETARLFAVYAPRVDARRSVSLDEVVRREREDPSGGEVLFTSDLEGKRRSRHCFEIVHTFRADRHVFPPRRGLTLFRTCGLKATGAPARPGGSSR